MTAPVRTAVIPAAGLGTRFLPATKAVPKEMIPVVDRPAIQWVVEEAVGAGIDDVLIITSPHKKPLEDHFDRAAELESLLAQKGKNVLLEQVQATTRLARFHFTRQGAPLGLGHAVAMAERHVGTEPFAVLLPDELIPDGGATLRVMIDAHEAGGEAVVALREVPIDEVSSYGCARVEPSDDLVKSITEIVEKPEPAEAPSNLVVVGRYVFGAEVFERLARTAPGKGGEIQLTDAMAELIADPGLAGVVFDARSFDTGQKLSWLLANVELGLEDPELGEDLARRLGEIVSERSGS